MLVATGTKKENEMSTPAARDAPTRRTDKGYKPVSLKPLRFEEAVAGLLRVEPEKPDSKKKAKGE